MRKKLSLCTNLVHEPELLILDEPGLGVDPISRRQLWEMLKTFRKRGTTVITATSYMDEAERCDRVLLLDAGTVIAIDTPAKLRADIDGEVFEAAGSDPMHIASELDRAAGPRAIQVLPDRVRFQLPHGAAAALRLPNVRPAAPVLEDVFARREARTEPAAPLAAPDEPRPGASNDGAPGILTDALTVEFGTFRAVDAVSLAVGRGEMLALLGPNGAGKTTLIRALCGLVRVAAGRGTVAGVPLGGDVHALRQRVGYMSQRFSLYLDLTTAENLAFFASAYGLGGAEGRKRIAWASAHTAVDLGDTNLVANLSGAQRQRLALACSILHAPPVLFLDEPTSGIDPAARYRFWRLIRSLASSGMTVLVTTHYLDEAAYCDRIAMMDRGRLVALGSLRELRGTFAGGAAASVEAIFVAALTRAQSAELAA
jgi:ABC-2 type transport system ATP-binding protein